MAQKRGGGQSTTDLTEETASLSESQAPKISAELDAALESCLTLLQKEHPDWYFALMKLIFGDSFKLKDRAGNKPNELLPTPNNSTASTRKHRAILYLRECIKRKTGES